MAAISSLIAATAAIVTSGIGAATANAQSNAATEARQDSKKNMAEQQAKQDALLADEKQKTTDEATMTEATQSRDMARNRQKALASGAQGRRDTILTSPLGIVGNTAPGDANAGNRKSLLGQ